MTITLSADGTRVEVSGLPENALAALEQTPPTAEQWVKILALHVVGNRDKDAPPMMGRHSVDGRVVAFTPRFPLRPGLSYRAALNTAGLAGLSPAVPAHVEQVFSIPKQRQLAPAEVTAVYPSADELPENLLKFYIHFSAPMARGDAYRHIRILDADDREIPGAYLRLAEELWSSDGRRFTLLFDPGRIKRGLVPHEEEGTPLVAGRQYTLAIEAGWRDAAGEPLATTFRKTFHTTAADESQPNPKTWKIVRPQAGSRESNRPPLAGTREPFTVAFDEPLDHALAERMIAVCNAEGTPIDGAAIVEAGERRWQFTPANPWRPGRHTLVVDGMLEDRAGNSPGRPFEVANAGEEVGVTAATVIELPFEIAAP